MDVLSEHASRLSGATDIGPRVRSISRSVQPVDLRRILDTMLVMESYRWLDGVSRAYPGFSP